MLFALKMASTGVLSAAAFGSLLPGPGPNSVEHMGRRYCGRVLASTEEACTLNLGGGPA